MMILLEMTLIGLAYYSSKKGRRGVVMANWWGKSKMICQSIGMGLVLLYLLLPVAGLLIAAQLILYLAIALAVISLITYSL
jgi:phosphatidylglycerophosphate synthase